MREPRVRCVGKLGCAVMLTAAAGLSAAPERQLGGRERGEASPAALWVWSGGEDPSNADFGGLTPESIGEVAAALASSVVAGVDARLLGEPPTIQWWSAAQAGAPGEDACFAVGLDLNELRSSDPERFADQRVNEALHALGVANARGVVLEVGPAVGEQNTARRVTAQLVVSYRSWEPEASVRVPLSITSSLSGPDRVVIQARFGAWIEAAVAAHRALLEPLRRSPFDAEVASWERRHGQKLRQVLGALEGPVVVGASGGDWYAMVGIGTRADAPVVMRSLAMVLGPVCERVQFDAQTSNGRATIVALRGTALQDVEWRLVQWEGRRWVLVTEEGLADAVASGLGIELGDRGGPAPP